MNPSIVYGGGIGFGAGEGLGDGGTGLGNGGSGLGSVGLGTGSVGPGPGLGAGIGSEIKPANELASPIATINPNPAKPHTVRLITSPFTSSAPRGSSPAPLVVRLNPDSWSIMLETNRFTLSRRLVTWTPLRAMKSTTMPAFRTRYRPYLRQATASPASA